MRVLQLIDSLNPGGAESVAINLANELVPYIEKSFLCSTRQEGALRSKLIQQVHYLFLNKKNTFDLQSLSNLHKFIKRNKIRIIHAHSTSFFLAVLIKLLNKKIDIIWHDHYGKSEFLDSRRFRVLKFFSKKFSHIFSVNKELEKWAIENLNCQSVSFLPNFSVLKVSNNSSTKLNGKDGQRIVSIANLRTQKDHSTLLHAMRIVQSTYPDWSLHCIGSNNSDNYALKVESLMKELDLAESVFFYGAQTDIYSIILQCEIGVLSSISEGLPLALIEYGLGKIAVVVTDVGQCQEVVGDCGIVVPSMNKDKLANGLMTYIKNESKRSFDSERLFKRIQNNYSKDAIVLEAVKLYTQISNG